MYWDDDDDFYDRSDDAAWDDDEAFFGEQPPDPPTAAGPFAEVAMHYAEQGLRVLPVQAGGKTPALVAWQHAATTDPATVGEWCLRYGDQNIGIATGGQLVVIDVDRKPGVDGGASLVALEERLGPLPRTVTVETGSGGEHLYFRKPESLPIKNSAGKLGVGIDVRGDRGFVVGVPSVHPGGGVY